MEATFKPGQRLLVKDNTGKPFNQNQTIRVIGIDSIHPTDGAEYKVYIENPDEGDSNSQYWQLDKAIKEQRIFVEVLED